MNTAVLVAILAIFAVLPRNSLAFVARGDSVYFDGFVGWHYMYHENSGNDNHLSYPKLWVNGMKNIGQSKEGQYSYMKISVFSTKGNIEIKQASANWANPYKDIDMITVGRFAPPFAEEWLKDPDQINLVGYSAIFDQLVYRDDGLQVDFHRKKMYISLGSFFGERSEGVARERMNGKVHLYSKVTLVLPLNVNASGSYRWSRTRNNLWAAYGKWHGDRKNISFEAVGFGESIQWFANYSVKVVRRVVLTARYENLREQKNRSIFGARFYAKDFDLKISSTLPGHLAGSPPRWVQAEVLFRF